MFDKRIIIGGLPRSGSSLLKNIVDSHPAIVCGHESGIFIRPYQEQLKQRRHLMKRFQRIYDIPRSTTKKIMKNSESAIECFDRIMEIYCEKNNIEKTIWADKTPRNCLNYQNSYDENQEVYFISIIRDGRDVVTSKKPHHEHYWCSVERYIQTMKAIYSFNKGRHLIVRYEDMTNGSDKFFRKLMGFLEIPFFEQMLVDYRKNKITNRREDEKTRSPITRKWVGRWREEQHRERIAAFMSNSEAVYWLKYSGYESEE